MAFSLTGFSDVRQLAEGANGKLYLAVQTSRGRKVLLKKMTAGYLSREYQNFLFEHEARTAASLEHDNIVRIYDFGEDRGTFYIVMEYIDGLDLEHLLQRKDFIPGIGLMAAFHAIRGLNYAHEHDIFHRDVKPSNIMISRSGGVKVVDFGLAYTGLKLMHMTVTEAVIDMQNFILSEQEDENRKKEILMDVWAVGALLYRICCGRFPFEGKSAINMLCSIMEASPIEIRDSAPFLPPLLSELIMLCLNRDPAKRPPSLEPLIEALQDYFFESGISDSTAMIRHYMSRLQV